MDWTYLTCGSLASEGGGWFLPTGQPRVCGGGHSVTGERLQRSSQQREEGRVGPLRDLEVSQEGGGQVRDRAQREGKDRKPRAGPRGPLLVSAPSSWLSSLATDSFICSFICFRICSFIYSFIPACYKGQVPVFSELAVY